MPLKLGIFAGSGDLPQILAESCIASNREFFILGLDGETPQDLLNKYPHAKVRIAAVGAIFKILREQGIEEVVLAGKIKRPGFKGLIPDLTGAKLLARITAAKFSGDDALLKMVLDFIAENDFKVVGAHEVAPELLTPKGLLTKTSPAKELADDISAAYNIAKEVGKLDIGQSLVFQAAQVLAVEAAEGTDEMIKRTAALIHPKERSAMLAKVCKPNQELRVDMPVVGIETVQNCVAAGIGGIILEAQRTMIINRNKVIQAADEKGIFIVGTVEAV